MWERNRGNYGETLEVNCELEKRYKLLFYESQLIARVEQAVPRGIGWPQLTNGTSSTARHRVATADKWNEQHRAASGGHS
jgi:hypothetical protein